MLGLFVLSMCNQVGLICGDGILPDAIINNRAHFQDLLYYSGFDHIHLNLCLMGSDDELLQFVCTATHGASCRAIVWTCNDDSYMFF